MGLEKKGREVERRGEETGLAERVLCSGSDASDEMIVLEMHIMI